MNGSQTNRINSARIIPAGDFRARDGRPVGLPGWRINSQIASNVIALASQRKDAFVIDYEHQSLSGNDAPAAGWFKRLEWREGDGLYMADISWTDRASAMLAASEYRYLSPVFRFDKDTGDVQEVFSVALTNTPALDGLADLAAASLSIGGLSVQAHFEPWNNEQIANLRQQQSAEHFKRVFGIELPSPGIATAQREDSVSEAILKCNEEDRAKLLHAFGHLIQS